MSSEPSGCEATQFAVAVTNDNGFLDGTTCVGHDTRVVAVFTYSWQSSGAINKRQSSVLM